MDHRQQDDLKENPRETANIFSIITFAYNFSLLRKGKNKELQEEDVYKVVPYLSSERLGDRLEGYWYRERKFNNNPSITRCLLRCFGPMFLCYTAIQLVFGTGFLIIQPQLFSKVVAYFQPNQTSISTNDAYLYAAGVIGLNIINVFYIENFFLLVTEYIVKVKTALCSLIYRKALKISPAVFSEMSIGKIVTLITKDAVVLDNALGMTKDMLVGFCHIVVVTVILYRRVGFSILPAVAVFLVIIPMELLLGRKTTHVRLQTTQRTDERIRIIQETLGSIKIIKMYNWEKYFEKMITAARKIETDKIKVVYYLKSLIVSLGSSTINLAFYILLVSYIARGYRIDAETIYFIQSCLGFLGIAVGSSIPFGIAQTSDMLASIRRIQAFLIAEETKRKDSSFLPIRDPKIYLDKVAVEIVQHEVLKSVSLNLDEGLLLVSGNVGSGKSTLLKTILREYSISKGEMEVVGTISYASQEPFLFPSSIRQNILFGEDYNERRYQEVLNVCALTYDINQFEKLDYTIVGDKGINLSKGQQARINLARAVYKNSDIYLLDDCLASLDNHVNNHIFEKCIREFLGNKLCVVVTNNINNIKHVDVSRVLFMENGTTLDLDQQYGSLDKRITYYMDEEANVKLNKTTSNEKDNSENSTEADTLLPPNKEVVLSNLYREQSKEGGVALKNYFKYIAYIGGFAGLSLLLLTFLAAQISISYADKLISNWVNLEPKITEYIAFNRTDDPEYEAALEDRENMLNLYTILIMGGLIFAVLRSVSSFYFCMKAARRLHKAVIVAILNTYMYFFDDHLIGNIINRLSKDFHSVDEYMPFVLYESLRLFFGIAGVITLITSVNWDFFIPAGILFVKLYFVQRFYLPTSRSLRRLEASTRSPMIGYLNSTLEGLTTIRASEQQNKLKFEFDRHQDLFTSTYHMNVAAGKLFNLLLGLFSTTFTMSVILKFLLWSTDYKAGDVGLAISQSMMLAALVQNVIRLTTEVESSMTSVERVMEYAHAKTENKAGQVIPKWPSDGSIRYKNVYLTYKTDGNTVLKNICFEVKGGSKVGIVGRTGAGKSSIISTLFRLYDFEGNIFIDNENTKNVSLDFLRSHIGIIPQDPVLFCGTVRSNIDPLGKYSDNEIWKALERVNMTAHITSLSQEINNSGSNYSVGEKQLLCLARELVRESKIIVLDEATANMDPETDRMVQNLIEANLESCTLLVIAHRLSSIMDSDKILVLDAGRIVEFDSPSTLLKNNNGLFYKMVKDDNFANIY
ncbi:ATP-binding cassette sub-family C member 4-like [Cylas formicarius]|uniref:ATP-binding cassette sub-family C member 4-like n=1 Tax=Cylas formicarius TaxID=197179 RepID=UPI002958BB61|nr:ATP-binding cassette sub-family C member 4-like [Cylas formicarius]